MNDKNDIIKRINYLEEYLNILDKSIKSEVKTIRIYNKINNLCKKMYKHLPIISLISFILAIKSVGSIFIIISLVTASISTVSFVISKIINNNLPFLEDCNYISKNNREIYSNELSMRKDYLKELELKENKNDIKEYNLIKDNNNLDDNIDLSLKKKL